VQCSGASRGLYEDVSQLLNRVLPNISQTRKPLASLNGTHIQQTNIRHLSLERRICLTPSVSKHKLLNSAAEYSAVNRLPALEQCPLSDDADLHAANTSGISPQGNVTHILY
jgi:hypothetical protein